MLSDTRKKEIEKRLEDNAELDHIRRYYGKDSDKYKVRYAEIKAQLEEQKVLDVELAQKYKEAEEAEEAERNEM